MSNRWQQDLERWQTAGLIDDAAGARIRAFEARRQPERNLGAPVALAVGLGALLLAAGVLLFVAAHWDDLSPGQRFSLVLALVAVFHAGGAMAVERLPVLASGLHAVGSVALGAGIFLCGQIFNLQEHWPGGVMLWAIGAWAAWALLRDMPQAMLAAMLTPTWLVGEWIERNQGIDGATPIAATGLLLLSIVYLTAPGQEPVSSTRRALVWIGALALLPLTALTMLIPEIGRSPGLALSAGQRATGWIAALGLPLALAWWLRRRSAWPAAIAALWVWLLATVSAWSAHPRATPWHDWGPYLICALGALGLVAWGLQDNRRERVNLGVAAFALTVLAFYFSTLADMLGRSASLVGLGALFVFGGWILERTRRRLIAKLERSPP